MQALGMAVDRRALKEMAAGMAVMVGKRGITTAAAVVAVPVVLLELAVTAVSAIAVLAVTEQAVPLVPVAG